jgi:arylsulfatase A-like enzyme
MSGRPGISPRQECALVYLFDYFPTICELAGAKPPATVEGKSLLPIVDGRQTKVRDCLFCAYRECQRMVRDERWKLIQYRAAGGNNTQLFDLAHDPDELKNLAQVEQFAAERVRLEKLMGRARREFGDPVDFDKPVAASSKP